MTGGDHEKCEYSAGVIPSDPELREYDIGAYGIAP
jgi:hypothetical protein